MKESEYIDATDLAKLRIADSILRSVFGFHEEGLKDIIIKLGDFIDELESGSSYGS